MLQKIRDGLQGQRWLAALVLGALALVFAAWGAYGIVDLKINGGNYAAKVDGQKISLEEAHSAWIQQQARMQQQFNGDLPDTFKQAMQSELLESMVRDGAVSQHAGKLGYRISDEQFHRELRNIPAFQIEGKYDPNVARERLAQAGMTDQAFALEMRRGLTRQQIAKGIQTSDFVTPLELTRLHALEDEQREVRYATLTPEKFAGNAPVDDAAVQDYLKTHQSSYMTLESVRLGFGELRLDQLAAQIPVSDAELHAAYDKSKDRYVVPEKRRAHHILIQGSGADALKKAQGVLAEAKAPGADFAQLARKYSQDPGSAAQGGDLGLADRGNFVGPFSDALFAMSVGEIRGPVKTQYGYHIIKLDEIQPGKTRSFDEARAEIDAQLRHDRAQDRLGDTQEQIARKLEQPGADFDALVKEFGLKTGEVPSFERGSGGAPLGAAQELQEVVFSAPVLNEKRIGGPVVLGEDRLVIVKALEHRMPKPRPVAEVRDQIVAAIAKERGTAAAAKAADATRARLLSGASFDDAMKEIGVTAEPAHFVSRKDPATPAPIRSAVFDGAKPAGKPVFRTVKLDDGGSAVVAITAVRRDPSASAPERQSARSSEAASRHGEGDVAAYIEEVRNRADVAKNPKAFE